MTVDLADLLFLVGGALVIGGVIAALGRHRHGKEGRLVQSDLPSSPGRVLRSSRYRLAGRPDEIRERRDGRWIPVEFKSRSAPTTGPPFSHRMQVAGYCLLIEETTGRSPPYGLLRYGDGTEFRVDWNSDLRDAVLDVRRAMAEPYDGRATPSHGRCARCPWRGSCDRAAG